MIINTLIKKVRCVLINMIIMSGVGFTLTLIIHVLV
jgi:hypothetical protein